MLISYEYYKDKYPNTELTETEYSEYYMVLSIYLFSCIVYTENEILIMSKLEEIKNILAYQIKYFEDNKMYKDGITSQSTNGASQSVQTDNKQGDLNISAIFDTWLKTSGLTVRGL